MTQETLICDIEVYRNYFLASFKRVSDGKIHAIEMSSRTNRADDDYKRAKVRSYLLKHRIITYNGQNFDLPLLWYFVSGANCAQLKSACDRIIHGNVKYWQVEDMLEIRIPRTINHIDLMEPQPNPIISLKSLNGRLHGKKMQDLPVDPDNDLSEEEMEAITAYCGNDLDATELLFEAIEDPLQMREVFREEYGMDFRSKSDSQMGEAMIKKRVEQIRGDRVNKVPTPPGTVFRYKVPDYISFTHPELITIIERLRDTDFLVNGKGKVDLPKWIDGKKITIGETTYAMGIGGLHSTEENRAVHSDESAVLIDFDVASYYPAIILNSGLYPKSLGADFLTVFRQIRDERVAAKRAGDKTKDKGLKIALNGCFGKLGSPYSVLYAPHLMIAVTLTGQLALLMLIDRAEQAGIKVVSANTDGVVFHCPIEDACLPVEKDRLTGEGVLRDLIEQWERDTGFDLEATRYASLYNQSVNSYIAVKPDGKVKIKGPLATPRLDGDMRGQLMKNPQMDIVTVAVVEHITKGAPLEDTIRSCEDIRSFVTVVKVNGGATWTTNTVTETKQTPWTGTSEGNPPEFYEIVRPIGVPEYLGKTVRYYWAINGAAIYRKDPHPSTGTHGKVPKTDGCRPLMELPDTLPDDIDYDRYVAEAREILMNIGFNDRPPPVKKLKFFKYNIGYYAALAV